MWAKRAVLSACILSELRRRSKSCKKNSALSPNKLSRRRRNFWPPNRLSVGKPLEMKPYKNQDPIRLVVADVDGTLVTQEKVLTAKTKEAVSKLTAAGIAFAITSGRPPRGMQMVIKDVFLAAKENQ